MTNPFFDQTIHLFQQFEEGDAIMQEGIK